MKMEVECCFETLVSIFTTTQRHIPEDKNMNDDEYYYYYVITLIYTVLSVMALQLLTRRINNKELIYYSFDF
jgi:hypothetical protein